ncbi:hippocampus abundant transcript 1 protein isoform X4 [Drosophila biarmipes]|uniref:hippocampus abundant transcript 1 protein isoform X4 n=1 Tax=Drosophila biarmipes TaxID=125945 RepID=UPI0021CCE26E|nr:hippocampus abundant transcript 1 protein isoform X4 [Drosophila biarmipes]
MAQLKFLTPLVKILVKSSAIGKASVWHAVIVTFMHYFAWGLLTVPFIAKITDYFGNHVLLVDGLVYGVRGILGFFATPVMGAVSDFQGRKVVMLLAVVTTFSPIPFMLIKSWWFFAILTVSSVCGSTYSSSLAYVADVTSVEERSKGYGIVAASFAAGVAFSPFLGNFLMNYYGVASVILLATVIGLINIAFIIFGVPESLVLKEQSQVLEDTNDQHITDCRNQELEDEEDGKTTINAKDRKQILNMEAKHKIYVLKNNPNNELPEDDITQTEKEVRGNTSPSTSNLWEILRKSSKDKNLMVIYIITFLAICAFAGVESTAPVYLRVNMGFEYKEVSMMLGLLSVVAITSNLLLGYLMKLVGAMGSIRLGLLLLLTQLLCFGLGTSHWMYWISSIFAALATVIPAANNAVASIYASPEHQGAVLGIISGIECLSEGVGPAFFGVLFHLFQKDSSHTPPRISPIPAPFAASAMGVLVALILTSLIKKETLEEEPKAYKSSDEITEDEDELEPLTKMVFYKGQKSDGYVKLEINDYYDSDCEDCK